MRIKTIFKKKTGKILGAQIVGYDGVDKSCGVLTTAIRAGTSIQNLVGRLTATNLLMATLQKKNV